VGFEAVGGFVWLKKFCFLVFGYGFHYRKPFKVIGYIYEKSDELVRNKK
jgi:hypothetical protein